VTEELLPSAGESISAYNILVNLDVICCKKRGKHEIDIALATQIPDMMVHATLKIAQTIETKAVKPLEGQNYMSKV
jgi:hypothetical protein